ncbi:MULTISPECIES: RdgB/HAM1 family non-canonical purine NTP pyrophosphatase [unclassified Azospirillum]|uniref:RdgB/HAM1 family non-canonical purine NTP pyrophosphatase n=1 Tax=unclassified Azospirillum TaxID=2630922 RepID=UPI000B7016DC|nr:MULTISPECIES: RdgB/HAM1 family non-canonical purine NTP pyrophosphatase [unclassified Azospirillum]SNS55305.1 XTP/dITP diphosphohydrolase [Azospirillum sp. RU38E]SNS74895.1 XTP/dITP diphosphohydrolase [Azospirillum sp. RU37A]
MSAPRQFTGDTLVIATHNKGKVPEIAALLKDYVAKFPSAGELGLAEPEETESTYIGNAALKARAAAMASGLPALADDSGVSVAGLDGAPGIYSARWAGPSKDFTLAMERVQRELEAVTDRKGDRAAFICALALAWPDGHVEAVEGRLDGTLTFPPRGGRGFGYDPIFIPDGYSITCGEMDPAEKQAISHRADAFQKLKILCFGAK